MDFKFVIQTSLYPQSYVKYSKRFRNWKFISCYL